HAPANTVVIELNGVASGCGSLSARLKTSCQYCSLRKSPCVFTRTSAAPAASAPATSADTRSASCSCWRACTNEYAANVGANQLKKGTNKNRPQCSCALSASDSRDH